MSMRSAAIAVAFSFMASVAGLASEFEEFFNSAASDLWTVRGSVLKEQLIAPTCVAERMFNDGAYVHLSKDIDEDLYYLWIHRDGWGLKGNSIAARINFLKNGEPISYASLAGVVRAGTDLNIPIDQPKAFLERLMLSDEVRVLNLGRAATVSVRLDNPIRIVSELGRCVDAWNAAKRKLQNPVSKGEK